MNSETTAAPITHVFDTGTRGFADQVVLWSVRKWVVGHKGSPTALTLLENAYARTSADGAVAHLDAMMRAITSVASRRIAVHACERVDLDGAAPVEVVVAHADEERGAEDVVEIARDVER